jgi:CO/xanthine dehydrogenase Mo-binding subunit
MSIGVSRDRVDAHDKVTGAARYPADIRRSDSLTALVVFTDQPHARLLSLDTTGRSPCPGWWT